MSMNTLSANESYWQATSDGAKTAAPSMQVMGRKGLWPGIEVGGGLGKLAGQIWRIGLMGEGARVTHVEALLHALRRELA